MSAERSRLASPPRSRPRSSSAALFADKIRPCFSTSRIASGNASMSFLSRSPIGIAVSLEIFAAGSCIRFRGLTQIDRNDAAGIALGYGLVQHDLGVAQIFRRDVTKNIGSHHAHRRSADHLLGKGTEPVAENDLFVIFLDDVKIALDASLQIDQHRRDLLPRQIRSTECRPVVAVHLFADFPPDDADITRGILQPYNLFESSGEFAYQGPQKNIPVQWDAGICNHVKSSSGTH